VQLGADVYGLQPESLRQDLPVPPVDEVGMDAAVRVAAEPNGLDMLVVDGLDLFAAAPAAGGDGSAALRVCMDGAWNATRAVVNLAFLPEGPGGEGASSARGGRVVYLAPPPSAGEYANAARAGLENLARTLVTIALGDATAPGEAAALTAYLASPAGAYFSGCQLDLRRP